MNGWRPQFCGFSSHLPCAIYNAGVLCGRGVFGFSQAQDAADTSTAMPLPVSVGGVLLKKIWSVKESKSNKTKYFLQCHVVSAYFV